MSKYTVGLDAELTKVIEADKFEVSPEGQVCFYIKEELIAFFSYARYITKGTEYVTTSKAVSK